MHQRLSSGPAEEIISDIKFDTELLPDIASVERSLPSTPRRLTPAACLRFRLRTRTTRRALLVRQRVVEVGVRWDRRGRDSGVSSGPPATTTTRSSMCDDRGNTPQVRVAPKAQRVCTLARLVGKRLAGNSALPRSSAPRVLLTSSHELPTRSI